MTTKALRCYDYVNQAYPRVCEALLARPLHVFQHATAAAASDAAKLHAQIGPFDIGTDISIRVVRVASDTYYGEPATRLELEWVATSNPGWFPKMTATLAIFPLSSHETELEIEGTYEPPIGKLGAAIDRALMRGIAEESVRRFVQEVAGWLRAALAAPTPVHESAPTPVDGSPRQATSPADAEC